MNYRNLYRYIKGRIWEQFDQGTIAHTRNQDGVIGRQAGTVESRQVTQGVWTQLTRGIMWPLRIRRVVNTILTPI